MSGCGELEPYALRVLDASMAPEFPAGCVVVVEPARSASQGDFVVADSAGGTVLRVVCGEGSARRLEALDAGVPPIPLGSGSDCAVVRGVVTQRAPNRSAPRKHYPSGVNRPRGHAP